MCPERKKNSFFYLGPGFIITKPGSISNFATAVSILTKDFLAKLNDLESESDIFP